VTFALVALLQACHALTDLDVTYVPCVPPPLPYTEQFDNGYQGLADRCWKAENVKEGRLLEASEDLVLSYLSTDAPVALSDDPVMLVRELTGDFVVVTHVEVTERQHSSFCLGAGDAAGLVVEAVDPDQSIRRVAVLVTPDANATEPDGTPVDCADGSDHPPPVIASVGETHSDPIWQAGEADIAICRSGDTLTYFFRQPAEPDAAWQPTDWKALAVMGDDPAGTIGFGPVSVGPVATIGPESVDVQVQGAFNWVSLPGFHLDCLGPLEDMPPPPND
jgi:hypothetical protein